MKCINRRIKCCSWQKQERPKKSTAASFWEDIEKNIEEIIPRVSFVSYWTDSPSSQYRNEHIILQHESLFDTNVAWSYFEAGRGKGPCDELGVTTKRMVDNAIKQRKYFI